MSFLEWNYRFGSSKQNTHVCIYIQEGDNGVPLNYYRFHQQTGLLFSLRLFRLHGYVCGNVRYNTHLYCLPIQAGFYSDAVECLTATQEILVRSSAQTKGV